MPRSLRNVKTEVATIAIMIMLFSTITVGGTNINTMLGKSCRYDDEYNPYKYCSSDGSEFETGFCGTDNICHANNCQNFFLYGPEQFTGRTATAAAEKLVCNPYDVCSAKNAFASTTTISSDDNRIYNGVSYGCDGVRLVDPTFEECYSEDGAVSLPFNEKCTYENNNNIDDDGRNIVSSSFNCYQFAAQTNFDIFLSRADTYNLMVEEGAICKGKEDEAVYNYINSYSNSSFMNIGSFNGGPNPTKAFNKNLALQSTFQSTLTTIDTTDASWSNSIHNNKIQNGYQIIVASAFSLLLFFFCFLFFLLTLVHSCTKNK